MIEKAWIRYDAAGRIIHLPHGAPSVVLEGAPQPRPAPPPADLAGLPRPLLGYIGSLVGREPIFEVSDQALRGGPTDTTLLRELAGPSTVDWRAGIRRMVTKFHPELVAD